MKKSFQISFNIKNVLLKPDKSKTSVLQSWSILFKKVIMTGMLLKWFFYTVVISRVRSRSFFRVACQYSSVCSHRA